MKKSELRQLIREEISKVVNEATRADIMAVMSDIRRFNRNESEEIDDLVLRTLNNLRFEATPDNIEAVTDHFELSMDDNYKIPEDPVIVKELYPMLKDDDVTPIGVDNLSIEGDDGLVNIFSPLESDMVEDWNNDAKIQKFIKEKRLFLGEIKYDEWSIYGINGDKEVRNYIMRNYSW